MSVPPPWKYVRAEPVAIGQDVRLDLTGPESASTWTLVVKAGFIAFGPPDAALSAAAATWVGGATHVIRVTVPAATTAVIEADDMGVGQTIYLEVWRTDDGSKEPLRRYEIPTYQPVRVPA